jgi:hypothetical protein
MTRLTLVFAYRPVDDLCLLELFSLLLMTVNTFFSHKLPGNQFLAGNSSTDDNSHK